MFPLAARRCVIATLLLLVAGFSPSVEAGGKTVNVLKTPDGGIQPQTVTDAKGVVHLLYFKGDPKAGDLFYARREPGKRGFTSPLRVNSQAGSAIAVGTIRGRQPALGQNGSVPGAWNSSGKAQ